MRLPDWLRTKNFSGLHQTRQVMKEHRLSTVCEEARCPNRGSCYSKPTATFMILGDVCTRNCGFCSVASANPLPVDPEEPLRVAAAARDLGLKFVVITSVTRDDLPDGGAAHFAAAIRAVRDLLPAASIEVLTPDFKGDIEALRCVVDAGPDVYNHNLETVPRLYPLVRPQADYQRSLFVLRNARTLAPRMRIKSGIMVGLGETFEEVTGVMRDVHAAGGDSLTVGQYLQPSKGNLPVAEYVAPEIFELYRKEARAIGFRAVASAPLVRSSMNAEEMFVS